MALELCYTGGVYDENTGLYYLNVRYYNPETGRFISRDTYEGTSEEPNSLHLYLYCANDPVNYVDPSGHRQIAVIFYTGYRSGKEKEHHGLRIEAYNSPYYRSEWSNVTFYKIQKKGAFNGIWKKIKTTNTTELCLYLHGEAGKLCFRDGSITSEQLQENLKKLTNKKLKVIRLLSCQGAKTPKGKTSVAKALWILSEKRAEVYAAKTKVSFRWKHDTVRAYRNPAYPGSFGILDPVQLQTF